MLRIFRTVLIILSIAVLASCGSTQLTNANIDKTEKRTNKLIEKLARKNDVVFFKKSTYSLYAYVWVYHHDNMECYIVNGIKETKNFQIKNSPQYIITKDDLFGLDNIYPYALDADIIGFAFYNSEKEIDSIALSCDIDEFLKVDFPLNYKLAIQLKSDYLVIMDYLNKGKSLD